MSPCEDKGGSDLFQKNDKIQANVVHLCPPEEFVYLENNAKCAFFVSILAYVVKITCGLETKSKTREACSPASLSLT